MMRESKTEKFIKLGSYGMGPYIMKKIKICPQCGQIARRTSPICPACKKMLTRKTLFDEYKKMHFCCPSCDIPLTGDSRYCPRCGRKVDFRSNE